MTLFAEDPRRIAGESLGAAAARWAFSGVAVALAFSGVLWFAANLPAPEGAQGDFNEAIIIDLEPMEAIEEAPPPAPEPVPEPPAEQPVAEAPPPPPEPVVQPEPEPTPPPPEPVAEPTPPEPVPPPPEPVKEPEPPPPEPVVEQQPPEPVVEQPPPPEPLPPEPTPPEPEPLTPEPVPELPQNDAAEAVLNAPVPAPKPVPPRPKVEKVERAEAKPRPVKKKPEPAKPRPVRQASTAPASSAPAARNTAAAPQVSQATWARQVISRIRAQAPRSAGTAGLTARVAFSIDRGGRVVSASIASSSGDTGFDREAVALVRRASPVPAPPEGVGGRTTALTVPVRSR